MTAIAYRAAELGDPADPPPDHAFIVDAWVRSYQHAFTAGMIQVEDWFGIMIPQVEKVLAKPDVRATVAYVVGVDRVADLVGFIVADTVDRPPLVYYVFTKEHYRRAGRGRLWGGRGIARGLFVAIGVDPSQPFNYVCSTPMCRQLARKIPLSRWQPELGRYPKHERKHRR